MKIEPDDDSSPEFISALNKLKEFNGMKIGHSKFEENQICGNLFKEGNKKGFFSGDGMYFRFFTLYFLTRKLFIDQNTKTTEGRKVIEFRSIVDCKEHDGQIILLTDRRKFILTAGNKQERELWMAGFNFVLANNSE